MRGAVLYELGLKVGEHCMRRHYGIVLSVPFLQGQHPPHRKSIHFDGLEYCTGVFDWLSKMVQMLSMELIVEFQAPIRTRHKNPVDA
jgi:hypothetical protein